MREQNRYLMPRAGKSNLLYKISKGKALRPDDVMIDVIIEGTVILINELAKQYTTCINKGKIPEKLKKANMMIIHMKGDKRDLRKKMTY